VIDLTTLLGARRELQDHHIANALVAARRLRHEDANAAALV